MNHSIAIWQLRSGADRRFRSGHPWVYSNELSQSPKGIDPGAPVELRDASGKFLARGYGNPLSLIAFRAMSRNADEVNPVSVEGIVKRLKSAASLRKSLGLSKVSYRWCFAEADYLPGLIIDRYAIAGMEDAQVIAAQAHTAGINRFVPSLLEVIEAALKETEESSWQRTAVVINNDVGVRKLEGLELEPARVLKEVRGLNLKDSMILVTSASGAEPLKFAVNLFEGQKTGFFLDQADNIQLAVRRLVPLALKSGGELRVLDLCTYVGQWSAQLAHAFKKAGIKARFTAVDASASALELAKKNIESQGAACEAVKMDVLRDLESLPDSTYDIVISDPPALIKGKKHIPAGTHAYLQLHTQVFRLVKKGGAVVCCSCSALLLEEEFLKTLAKAAQRNQTVVRWVGRGAQSSDHPLLAEFSEGRYLKSWIGFT